MKLPAVVLTAWVGVLLVVPGYSQTKEANSGEPFQVRKNVLLTHAAGARLVEQRFEDFKLFEDGVGQQITGLSENLPPLYLQIVQANRGQAYLCTILDQGRELRIAQR